MGLSTIKATEIRRSERKPKKNENMAAIRSVIKCKLHENDNDHNRTSQKKLNGEEKKTEKKN